MSSGLRLLLRGPLNYCISGCEASVVGNPHLTSGHGGSTVEFSHHRLNVVPSGNKKEARGRNAVKSAAVPSSNGPDGSGRPTGEATWFHTVTQERVELCRRLQLFVCCSSLFSPSPSMLI